MHLYSTLPDVEKIEGLKIFKEEDTFSSMFMTVHGFFHGHNCLKLSS
jgi:hypothetical protein